MRVMDPEKDKRTAFENCLIYDLSSACSTEKLAGKVRVSSAEGQAAAVGDDDVATAWTADAAEGQWVELDFGKEVAVNEFKIKEDASSSITRFAIDVWDDETSSWRNCFHGAAIGKEFIAPIVGRTTTKARMQVLRTKSGNPAIAEFAAYDNTTGEELNMERGKAAPDRIGK